jgi:hypothetical protein
MNFPIVMNRQTYETYRFTIGDDVAHVGPPCDLAKARRTAMAFLAQRNAKTRPVADPQPERDGAPIFPAPKKHCHHDR